MRHPSAAPILASLSALACLSAAALAHPGRGIAVDDAGAVYVGDVIHDVIWKISPEGRPEVFARNVHAHWITLADGPRFALYADHEVYEPATKRYPISVLRFSPAGERTVVLAPADAPPLCAAFLATPDGAALWKGLDGAPRILLVPAAAHASDATRALAVLTRPVVRGDVQGRNTDKPSITGMAWVAPPPGADAAAIVNDGVAIHLVTSAGAATALVNAVPIEHDAPPPDAALGALWGVAIDAHNAIYTADPDFRRTMRITNAYPPRRAGAPTAHVQIEPVAPCEPPWFPTGVATRGDTLYILEHGLEGNHNLGPRIRILAPDGAVRTLVTITDDTPR